MLSVPVPLFSAAVTASWPDGTGGSLRSMMVTATACWAVSSLVSGSLVVGLRGDHGHVVGVVAPGVAGELEVGRHAEAEHAALGDLEEAGVGARERQRDRLVLGVAHAEAGDGAGGVLGVVHHVRAGAELDGRVFVHVEDRDRDGDRVGGLLRVGRGDAHAIAGPRLMVERDRRRDLAGGGVDGEEGLAGPVDRVGQGVARVRVLGRDGSADGDGLVGGRGGGEVLADLAPARLLVGELGREGLRGGPR